MPPRRPRPKTHLVQEPQGYCDIFDIRDPRKGPLVLADCTSIRWPKGWSQRDAERWRKANRLEKTLKC